MLITGVDLRDINWNEGTIIICSYERIARFDGSKYVSTDYPTRDGAHFDTTECGILGTVLSSSASRYVVSP